MPASWCKRTAAADGERAVLHCCLAITLHIGLHKLPTTLIQRSLMSYRSRNASNTPLDVDAIVFDKDGTLIDLHARWAPWFSAVCGAIAADCADGAAVDALRMALGVAGDRLIAESPAAVLTNAHIKRTATDLMVGRGHARSAVEAKIAAAFASQPVGKLVPLGGVAATMARLVDRGFKLAIATSDDRANTLAELAELGIAGLVGAIRCGDDVGSIKPDPEVLLGLAVDLGVSPQRMIFVGDSLHDMATAHAAAVPFVAVVGGSSSEAALRAGSAAVVTAIDELLPLLG